jgi:hypothetical protein
MLYAAVCLAVMLYAAVCLAVMLYAAVCLSVMLYAAVCLAVMLYAAVDSNRSEVPCCHAICGVMMDKRSKVIAKGKNDNTKSNISCMIIITLIILVIIINTTEKRVLGATERAGMLLELVYYYLCQSADKWLAPSEIGALGATLTSL